MLKKITFKLIIWLVLLIWLPATLMANNISLTNSSLTDKNTTDKFILVQFDLTWENSWRTSVAPANWDAAWVFVKYRISVANGGDGIWKHAWLNNTGHTAPTGSTIDIGLLAPETSFNASTNPGLGAFIYNSADYTGTNTWTSVKLRWNYGTNSVPDNAVIEIEAYAIEMVYVPKGSFYVGTGGAEVGSFTNGSWASPATPIPFQITSEAALEIGPSAGKLWGISSAGSSTIGSAGTLAASFPKGVGAFYCMKYEISQQGYVDFLNSLTQTQATARKYDKPTPTNYRYEITGSVVGEYATTNPYVACNFLNWYDLAAYLDWSGLRPMTELEFEKACRGTAAGVPNECAWGNASFPPDINSSRYTINNSGANNEAIATNYATPPIGNVAYATTAYNLGGTGIPGPVRVGIFAGTSGNTGRISSGATYYGVMEMSGNVRERTITVGNASGRLFNGTHGNGLIDGIGLADVSTWPSNSGATGTGVRGGSIQGIAVTLQVSDRTFAALGINTNTYSYGGRGLRSFHDVTPPTPGNSGLVTAIPQGNIKSIASPVDVSWTSATDKISTQANLQYLVYYSRSNDISTVTDCETNGTPDGSYFANITTKTVVLHGQGLYYFNVVVKDEAGNKAAYTTTEPVFVGGCFIAGTKISMADGTTKNIEKIVAGDIVKSVNMETMEVVNRTVTYTVANPPDPNLTSITFSNGMTNVNNKAHRYWVIDKGWSCVDPALSSQNLSTKPEVLSKGDKVLILEKGRLVSATVNTLEVQSKLVLPTFNFTVDNTNTYFANGFLVITVK